MDDRKPGRPSDAAFAKAGELLYRALEQLAMDKLERQNEFTCLKEPPAPRLPHA